MTDLPGDLLLLHTLERDDLLIRGYDLPEDATASLGESLFVWSIVCFTWALQAVAFMALGAWLG